VNVGEALRHVEVFGEGVGADGYLLTPGGATKLLRACETDFYTCHVDWRLARYATMVEVLESLGALPVADVIRHHHDKSRLPTIGLLRGYVVKPALTVQHTHGQSWRENIDKSTAPPAGHIPLSRYSNAFLGTFPEGLGELRVLETPKEIPQIAPAMIEDLSGRGLNLAPIPERRLHGSYLVQRQNVLLFGPNNLVTLQGELCCEARQLRE
jgi:hypothetical protein